MCLLIQFQTGFRSAFGKYYLIRKHSLRFHCLHSNLERKGVTDQYNGWTCILTGLKLSKNATALYNSMPNNKWCTRVELAVWCIIYLKVCRKMMYLVWNDHLSVSNEKKLKYMAAYSHMSNKKGPKASMHKITDGIKILINPVSAAEDMIPDLFNYFQVYLETLVVSEQIYILTRGYEITYETK